MISQAARHNDYIICPLLAVLVVYYYYCPTASTSTTTPGSITTATAIVVLLLLPLLLLQLRLLLIQLMFNWHVKVKSLHCYHNYTANVQRRKSTSTMCAMLEIHVVI